MSDDIASNPESTPNNGNVEEVPDPIVGESIEIPLVEFSQAVSAIIQEAESGGGGGGGSYEEITFVKTEDESEEEMMEEHMNDLDERDVIATAEDISGNEDEIDEQKGIGYFFYF